MHATISKIDAQKHWLTVKTMDKNGKEQEQTLQLSNDVKFLSAAGKDAKADSFKSGDDVCVMEKDGKVTEAGKEAEAKITKVDSKAGTITVQMTDENGEKTSKRRSAWSKTASTSTAPAASRCWMSSSPATTSC